MATKRSISLSRIFISAVVALAAVSCVVEPEVAPVPTYRVSVSSEGGGLALADAERAEAGAEVTFYAVASSGYVFSHWGGSVEPTDPRANPLTIAMPAGDVRLTAIFVAEQLAAERYAMEVTSAGNGTAVADRDMGQAGERITLAAVPDAGFVFDRWSGSVALSDPTANPATFTMPAADVAMRAAFRQRTYRVSVSDNGNGSVAADKVAAARGDTVALTATPNEGYSFGDWVVLGGEMELTQTAVGRATFEMPDHDVVVVARFTAEDDEPDEEEEPKYDVAVASGGNGTAQADVASAEAGETVTLAAVAADGFVFARWVVVSGDVYLDAALNPTRFTMPARAVEVRAEFEAVKTAHAIVITNDGNGSASVSKPVAMQGERITLVAHAAEGYIFSRWVLTDGAVSDLTAGFNPATFTMPDGAVAVRAEFAVKPPDENSITVLNDGHGTASASSTLSKAGIPILLSATPEPGYEFARWVVTEGAEAVFLNDATDPAARFIMPAARVELRAEFKKTIYNIVVTDDGHGSAVASKPGATMQETITLTATPAPGYEFSRWMLVDGDVTDLTSTVDPATFTMPIGAVEIRAEFRLKTLNIVVITDGKGTASPDRPTAKMGESIMLTAAPTGSDYLFLGWKVLSGGVTVSGGATASFTLSSEDVEIMAQFVHIPREPFILHLDSNGRLAAGQWGNTLTRDNILYFKLGSLVGMTTPASIPNGTMWPESRALTKFYNPSTVSEDSFVNYYYDVPGYTTADEVTDVSKDDYNTDAKALAGKGDACRLIGLTAEEARAMARVGTLAAYNSGFRMPTYAEMDNDYVKGGSAWTTIGSMGGRWRNSAPDASTFLPAVGDRSIGGKVEEVGSMGTYWAANGINNTYGGARCIEFHQGSNQMSSPPWEYGFPIRCVRE